MKGISGMQHNPLGVPRDAKFKKSFSLKECQMRKFAAYDGRLAFGKRPGERSTKEQQTSSGVWQMSRVKQIRSSKNPYRKKETTEAGRVRSRADRLGAPVHLHDARPYLWQNLRQIAKGLLHRVFKSNSFFCNLRFFSPCLFLGTGSSDPIRTRQVTFTLDTIGGFAS